MNKENPHNTTQWNEKNEILLLILKEYYRIYKEAILRKKDSISKEIVQKLEEILTKIISEKENIELLEIFFGTTAIGENYNEFNYYEFMKLAIENKDNSRFKLSRFIIALINGILFNESELNEKNLDQILTSTLFQINRLIIDNDDFELFKEQIDMISRSLFIKSPVEIQKEIIYNLTEAESQLLIYNQEIHEKNKSLSFLVKYILSRNFNCWKLLSEKIDEFGCDILTEMAKSKDKYAFNNFKGLTQIFEGRDIRRFRTIRKSYEYFVSSLLYRTFFMVGAYIILKNRKKSISGIDYIKELWIHHQLENHGVISSGKAPSEFNEFWLINLYLFGGINNEAWDDLLDYRLENFHEMNAYMIQYFILNLIKSYDLSKNIFNFNLKNNYENEALYNLISIMLLKKDDLIHHIGILDGESEDWSDLLKKEIESKLKITIINEKRMFELAKILITKFFNKLEEYRVTFESVMPLYEKKVSNAKEEILRTYLDNSRLPELFQFKYNENLRGYKKIAHRPISSKDCFISTSIIDCDLVWQHIGKIIVSGEENHLLKLLQRQKDALSVVNKSDIAEIYNTITKTFLNLLDRDLKPNLLFMPLELFRKISTESVNSENKLLFKKVIQNKFIKIDNDNNLEVVCPDKFLDFNEIIVMNTNSILWSYKLDNRTNKRLWMDIVQFEENSSKVDVCIRSKMKIEIINPEGIEIIKIK